MPVRVSRIAVKRGGPLSEDLMINPGSLNLIYGRNETGKTYLLEAMVSFLFRTGKSTLWTSRWTASQQATLREWDPAGEIVVTGLEEGPTVFGPGTARIEDFAESDPGLPRDLSRLMVVRAGETRLSGDRDGVGSDVLRTYLSGDRVLSEVEAAIDQKTVMNAVVTDGRIEAEKRGLVDRRLRAFEKLEYLDSLLMDVRENASLSTLKTLEKKKRELEARLLEQDSARRHRAYIIEEQRRKLRLKLDRMPSERELVSLGSEIGLYRAGMRNLMKMEEALDESSDEEETLKWLRTVREDYLAEPDTVRVRSLLQRYCPPTTAIAVALTVAGGFASRTLMIVAGSLALIGIACMFFSDRSEPSSAADERRRRIEAEFERRFGRELTDTATLKALYQEVESRVVRRRSSTEARDELVRELQGMEEGIRSRFYGIAGRESAPEEWDDGLEALHDARAGIQEEMLSAGNMLAALNVPPESYVSDPPRVEWDQEAHLLMSDELNSVSSDLERERETLRTLRNDIAMATGVMSRNMEDLITALEDKRESVVESYRDLTARILAGNLAYRAVCEYRERENTTLVESLGSAEVINPLYRITGRYNGACLGEDGEILLRTSSGMEYPLSRLSTGAAEQVYIALRTGFAELSMGQPAFVLLDDAFQHSDWERRKNLVDHAVGLVESGWQIFYFTMDEHLRKLFDTAGRNLDDGEYMHVTLG